MSLTPIELRHKLHQNPELSFNEVCTTETLIENIKGLENSEKIKIHTPYKTGLLVEYKVNEKPFIMFRADIDALPIKEENEIAFKSQNRFMHACGHDVHTSILYSFLSDVIRNKINQNILFLFQPAEESGGGAMEFYNTGIFEQFEIQNSFALHVTDEYEQGAIASTAGVLFASSLEVNVDFYGNSAHVAFPREGKNALNALRQFLDAADKIPKSVSAPLVFGVGKVFSGEIRNIIPAYARLEGTLRGLSNEEVLEFYTLLNQILKGIESITGVKYKMEQGANYPEVIIDENLFNTFAKSFSEDFNFIDCGYKMTGEDFGFFSQKFPSFMFWLGVSKGERNGLHNPKFLPDDEIINIGNRAFHKILNYFISNK